MLESFFIVAGAASIVGLFVPATGWKQRLTHVVYTVIIAGLSYGYVGYKNELAEIKRIERAAEDLLENRRQEFTDAGYIQAVLTFLEKHKNQFPDAYARANEICNAHDCNQSKYKKDGVESLQHSWGLIELSSQMDGILKGIIAVNDDS